MTETMKTSWAKLNDKSNKNTRTRKLQRMHTHTLTQTLQSGARRKAKQNKA